MAFSGMQDEQSLGFWNRSIVALLVMFTVPALLVIGGFFYVAMQGRIPGGIDSSCERVLNDLTVRIDMYAYQSGFAQFQLQTFSISDHASTWRELFKDDLHAPRNINCDDNIIPVSEDILVLFNAKTVAISADKGATWQFYRVCDGAVLIEGRCDADSLNILSVDLADNGQARILVHESIVDDYGEPLSENGEILIKQEFVLQTSDFGHSWSLANEG